MVYPSFPSTCLPPVGEGSESLNGLGVLVTRPEHQAGPLCQWIEQHGGVVIRCPALVIGEPRDWTPALAIFDRLADYNLAIFTSANAVDRAMPPIRERGGFPSGLEIAAIGPATARALARHGVDLCLQPEQGFTSEALLALPRFQRVTSQAIVIVRGEGGRELLAETLTARGARVEHAEVYRRERPALDAAALLERWRRGEIGAVIVTSSESLSNLFDLLGVAGQDYLRQTPVIAVSARTAQTAANFGCHHPLLAREASDAAIAAALLCLVANPSLPVGNTT
ncbi:MAG: uroporphyrinogen-III synthase [Candidatus Contendobacter sp.]|nr:uroporphyrinogen-III synthase [Candidatus Contendobacter sp.]MDG4556790.1 uroporphyrinogen-III synthase [Candidatus Contendobacter sp.]